ncbi:hypothetical protein [Desulforamulus ruminis]|uniref:hypothetical protein n=1 Tax=Desulforamulus ruminis TaxID=1564 RepID=UPI0002E58D8A|nr:hypothetical protein [Desulforamulus ruminis]
MMQQFAHQAFALILVALIFLTWVWLGCKMMKTIPSITQRLGWGETPGLVAAVFALWPLFALTYQLFRFILPS